MALTINLRHSFKAASANEVTCELGGKLDNATAPDLSRALMPVLNGKPTLLIFDLAKLQFVTSMGIRMFFAAQKKQKEHGGKVSFVNLSPQIKEVFDIMGSLPDVKIFKDTAELDAYLLSRQQKS